MPSVDCRPLYLKLSLIDTGTPWRGPIGFPCSAMYASRNSPRLSASSKKISVRQFASCWAIAARLQNAVATVDDLIETVETAFARDVASRDVMDSSVRDKMPQVAGMSRMLLEEVSSTPVRYSDGRSHSLGILESWVALLAAALVCQVSAMVLILC